MAASARHTLLRAAVAVAIASAVAGCATRYDVNGNLIYRWQFGQDTSRAIDYSNPRLPQLPANRPSTDLWPVPSPYQFKKAQRSHVKGGRSCRRTGLATQNL